MPKETTIVAITIRLAPEFHEKLKAAYWKTSVKHRLSFNAWICEVLAAGLAKKA